MSCKGVIMFRSIPKHPLLEVATALGLVLSVLLVLRSSMVVTKGIGLWRHTILFLTSFLWYHQ